VVHQQCVSRHFALLLESAGFDGKGGIQLNSTHELDSYLTIRQVKAADKSYLLADFNGLFLHVALSLFLGGQA